MLMALVQCCGVVLQIADNLHFYRASKPCQMSVRMCQPGTGILFIFLRKHNLTVVFPNGCNACVFFSKPENQNENQTKTKPTIHFCCLFRTRTCGVVRFRTLGSFVLFLAVSSFCFLLRSKWKNAL